MLCLLPLILVALCFLVDAACCESFLGSTSVRNPLCDFAAATNIESFYVGWNCTAGGQPVTDPCLNPEQWVGIGCTLQNITSFDISTPTLEGTLPEGLGLLTDLTNLSMYTTCLEGSVPSTLGLLTQLEMLTMASNALSVGRCRRR